MSDRTSQPHVLLICQTFWPDISSTGQVLADLASHLDESGWRVTVVASRQRFLERDKPPFDSYEKWGNIEIHRIAGRQTDKRSVIGRLREFLSFTLFSIPKASRVCRKDRPDVVFISTPPPLIGLVGAYLKRRFRIPFVYECMDVYPEVLAAFGLLKERSLPVSVLRRVNKWMLNRADGLIVLGRDMRELVRTKLKPECLDRVVLAQPWSDGSQLVPIEHDDNPMRAELVGRADSDDSFVVAYSGNMGVAHDAQTLLEGWREFCARRPEPAASGRAKLVFIGDGKRYPELHEFASAHPELPIEFLPYQPREKLTQSLGTADVHLISQLPAFTGLVVPSKLFGIMAAGRPAVMVGPAETEIARVLSDHSCGMTVANGDATALADALEALADDPGRRRAMGRRAREAFLAHYDKPVLCGVVESTLTKAILSSHRIRPGLLGRGAPDNASAHVLALADDLTERSGAGREPTRITIINQFYPPDLSPTAHLSASLAEHRAEMGDRVTVVTSAGSHILPKGTRDLPKHDNPRVHRVWTPGLGKVTLLRRIADYTSFYLLAAWRSLTMPRQDIIISLTTPPCIAWTAVLHKMLHPRTRLVLWNMDCYPDVAERSDAVKPGGMLARMMRGRNRAIFRKLDLLVCLDGAMARLICTEYARYNPDMPVAIIPNWEPLDLDEAERNKQTWPDAERLGLDGRFVVLYLGNTGYGHQFDTVLDAAQKLRDEPVTFLFVGGGTRWSYIQRTKEERDLGNVILHDYVPKEQTPAVMRLASCGLTTLRDAMLGTMSPSKIHSNFAMCLPMIYVGPESSNVDDAIRGFGCGVSLRHGDTDGLVAFVRSLMDDPDQLDGLRANARRAFEEAYSDRVTLPQFDRVIDAVLGTPTTDEIETAASIAAGD
jgi:colanic acid biosynthesis glycosyl transferase WcaI